MQGKRTFKLELSEDEMSGLMTILYWTMKGKTAPRPDLLKADAQKYWFTLAGITDGEGTL